jgi:hypothetical protein
VAHRSPAIRSPVCARGAGLIAAYNAQTTTLRVFPVVPYWTLDHDVTFVARLRCTISDATMHFPDQFRSLIGYAHEEMIVTLLGFGHADLSTPKGIIPSGMS